MFDKIIKGKELSLPHTSESRKMLLPQEIRKGEELIILLSPTEERIRSEKNLLARAIMQQLGGMEILPV